MCWIIRKIIWMHEGVTKNQGSIEIPPFSQKKDRFFFSESLSVWWFSNGMCEPTKRFRSASRFQIDAFLTAVYSVTNYLHFLTYVDRSQNGNFVKSILQNLQVSKISVFAISRGLNSLNFGLHKLQKIRKTKILSL